MPQPPLGPEQGPFDAAFLEPRTRETPYGKPTKRIIGKTSFKDEFFAPEGMDTAASTPGAVVPMEEQNTVPKRPLEESSAEPKKKATPKAKSKAKKKEEVAVVSQTPKPWPPPPPGAVKIKAGAKEIPEEGEPDVEPTASSASSSKAPSSVGHYRKKAAPEEVIDDLPAVPIKRKTEKPLEDGTPAALRPERQRPRAPQAEPDAEPTPLRIGGSSSSSSGPSVASQRRLM